MKTITNVDSPEPFIEIYQTNGDKENGNLFNRIMEKFHLDFFSYLSYYSENSDFWMLKVVCEGWVFNRVEE